MEKTWLAELEQKEREKTGIKNLRIKYNKVFGYYLEVTNSFKNMVPDYYTRKQTLTNAERYIIPELKDLEDLILGAEDKLYALEYELYCDVRNRIADEIVRIQTTAKQSPRWMPLLLLHWWRSENHYVRPKINEKGTIDIKDGRHPVVEMMIPNHMFIANDTYLDDREKPGIHHHRTEYGGKVYLYAADGADRADGTDRFLCACIPGKYRSGGPDLYEGRCLR